MADNEAFLQRLQATFRAEAQERLQSLSSALIALESAEQHEQRQTLVEAIFRDVHSLKGAARAVDKIDVERLCQTLENVLSALKREDLAFSSALGDLLLEAVDLLQRLLESPLTEALAAELESRCTQLDVAALERNGTTAATPTIKPTPVAAKAAPTDAAANAVPAPTPPPVIESPASSGNSVRIATAKLDSLLLQIESLLSIKLIAQQRSSEAEELDGDLALLQKSQASVADELRLLQRWSQRAETNDDRDAMLALRKLLDVFAQQDLQLQTLHARQNSFAKACARDEFMSTTMIDSLLDDAKQASLQPIASVFDMLPKLVRDLARNAGKDVDLQLRGGEIEIDRRILEQLRDPLLHLVRNAIDHGIEKLEQRAQSNKTARAILRIEAQQIDGKIQLTIADDGAGIDRERVRAAAQRLGKNIESEEDEQVLALIFESGLSTSPIVTDISGRGLGLAIVREKILALGGSITLSSNIGRGTQFRLLLPLTLATYRGVHVLSGGRQFVFPLTYVERVTQIQRSDIALVHNRETLSWHGRAIALVRLTELLNLPSATVAASDKLSVVIGAVAERRVAFVVDAVVGEQDVLVKNLGSQLLRVRNIAAATVLGDGRVALILNVQDLFKVAATSSGRVASAETAIAQPKSILVAEDSITSRLLLRGLLESAGYRVVVAVDGEDAFAKLREDNFDLLVSDVEMPRLSGFDLAARVRADQQLQALPIVLVTSLASTADRERGIDVGASAYIVKSNFEEGNLLAAIERLL